MARLVGLEGLEKRWYLIDVFDRHISIEINPYV